RRPSSGTSISSRPCLAMSCVRPARPALHPSACSLRARNDFFGVRATQPFGSQWLASRLAALLPGFPAVRLVVAFSGGVDSTAVLAALAAERPKALRVRAAHVNHGLHPNAAKWSEHCRAV